MNEHFRDGDFISRRFRRLGRHWWWAVLALGMLGAFLFRSAVLPQHTAHLQFQAPSENALLKSLELVEVAPTVLADVLPIRTKEFEQKTEDAVLADISVGFEVAEYSVSIRLSSSSRASLIEAAGIYAEAFLSSRGANIARGLQEIGGNLQYSVEKIDLRIKELDAELATIEDPRGSLAQALLFDRSTANTERTELLRKLSAVQTVVRKGSLDVTKSQDISSPSNSAIRQFLPGFSFGLFVGVIGLYLFACFDRKIRFRDDLIATTGTELLGVVKRSAQSETEDRLAITVRSILERRGDSEAVLFLVNDLEPDTKELERFQRALNSVCSIRVEHSLSPKDEVVLDRRPVILVAAYGKSTISSVEQAARELSLSERPLLGSVLVGVPDKELQRVHETPVSRFRFY